MNAKLRSKSKNCSNSLLEAFYTKYDFVHLFNFYLRLIDLHPFCNCLNVHMTYFFLNPSSKTNTRCTKNKSTLGKRSFPSFSLLFTSMTDLLCHFDLVSHNFKSPILNVYAIIIQDTE